MCALSTADLAELRVLIAVPNICAVSGKRIYTSAGAKQALASLRSRGKPACSTYSCEHCHHWHLTSRRGWMTADGRSIRKPSQ